MVLYTLRNEQAYATNSRLLYEQGSLFEKHSLRGNGKASTYTLLLSSSAPSHQIANQEPLNEYGNPCGYQVCATHRLLLSMHCLFLLSDAYPQMTSILLRTSHKILILKKPLPSCNMGILYT